MSAMTVTSSGISGNTTTNGGGGEPTDGFTLFHNRAPVWPTTNPTLLDHHWNESIFSPTHQQQQRTWPTEPFGNDIDGDELPYPRQTTNHNNNDFSPLPSSPAALLNGSHLGQTGRFQFPNDSTSSPFIPQQLPPMSSCFTDSLYDPSPSSVLFTNDLDRSNTSLLDARQQQQLTSDNSMLSRDSKLILDQMAGRFADLQLQPPPSAYPSYQNPFLSPSNDQQQQQQQQQQQLLSSFYYQQSSPSTQQMVNPRLPPPPFANHMYLNSTSSPHAQYPLAQQQPPSQPNGPGASNLFNDRYERNDGYLPFSNNSSYLSAMRFSPNPAYRTTKSGKQQIGPENSNLFICHLPQETTDQTLMNLFSQFGKIFFFEYFRFSNEISVLFFVFS